MLLPCFFEEPEKIKLKSVYHEETKDFEQMFKIQQQVINSQKRTIQLDATECQYISPTCFIILSSLILYANENKKMQIKFKDKTDKLRQTLINNGLIISTEFSKSNKTLPLNKIEDEDDAQDKISQLVEMSQLKNLPQEKKDEIISRLYEIPSNALNHSQSSYGIICCGYYTNKKEFVFSVYDLGIGIPKAVRNHLKKPNMSAKAAINWALKEGNSTSADEYSRGLGFVLLEDFRKLFNGKITLISENVVYLSSNRIVKHYLTTNMPGTLYTIKIMV